MKIISKIGERGAGPLSRQQLSSYLRVVFLAHVDTYLVSSWADVLLRLCHHFLRLGLENECHFEFSNFSLIIMIVKMLEKPCISVSICRRFNTI